MVIDETLLAIRKEAMRAHGKYGAPTSTHESLGVMLEEFEELKTAIHENSKTDIEREAIQLASVAYRLALELSLGKTAFFHRSNLQTKKGEQRASK